MPNFELQIERKIQKKGLSKKQRSILQDFTKRKTSDGRLPRPETISGILTTITELGVFHKKREYEEMTKEDVEAYIDHLREIGRKESTMVVYGKRIRTFFHWLGNEDCIITIRPERNQPIGDPNRRVYEEEVLKMIEACQGKSKKRDQTMIATLWDTGVRSGELLGMNIGDISLNDEKPRVRVNGKTGRRSLPLHYALPYLNDYIHNECPDDNTKPLFRAGKTENPLSKGGLDRVIINAVKLAKIERNIHAHLFRHGRARDLVKKGLHPRDLMKWGGWSNMRTPLRYTEIDGDELYDAFAQVDGVVPIKERKLKESLLRSKICPYCDTELTPTTKRCPTCQEFTDPEARKQHQNDFENLQKHFLKFIRMQKREIGTQNKELEALRKKVDAIEAK